jgi:hypothetical protein
MCRAADAWRNHIRCHQQVAQLLHSLNPINQFCSEARFRKLIYTKLMENSLPLIAIADTNSIRVLLRRQKGNYINENIVLS